MQKPLWFVSQAWEGDSLLLFVLAWLFWLLEEVGEEPNATGASRGNSLGPGRVMAEAAGLLPRVQGLAWFGAGQSHLPQPVLRAWCMDAQMDGWTDGLADGWLVRYLSALQCAACASWSRQVPVLLQNNAWC